MFCPAWAEVIHHLRALPLTRGRIAVVDAEDYEAVSRWKWSYCPNGGGEPGYAARWERYGPRKENKRRKVWMHHQIAQPPEGMEVDHRNRVRLDNRKSNLRVCTRKENVYNQGPQKGSRSRFKGVYWSPKGWQAAISVEGRRERLGVFETEEEAARAYNEAALRHFGPDAYLNAA